MKALPLLATPFVGRITFAPVPAALPSDADLRFARRQVDDLGQLVRFATPAVDQKFDMHWPREEQVVVCGEHGYRSTQIPERCSKCGGRSMPIEEYIDERIRLALSREREGCSEKENIE